MSELRLLRLFKARGAGRPLKKIELACKFAQISETLHCWIMMHGFIQFPRFVLKQFDICASQKRNSTLSGKVI